MPGAAWPVAARPMRWLAAVMLLVSGRSCRSPAWAARRAENTHSLFPHRPARATGVGRLRPGGAAVARRRGCRAALADLDRVARGAVPRSSSLRLAVAFCVGASVVRNVVFDVQNSRNVKASFLPAGRGLDRRRCDRRSSAGGRNERLLEQFFWKPGAAKKTLHAACRARPQPGRVSRVERDPRPRRPGALAGVGRARVGGSTRAGARSSRVAPPSGFNGPWLSARTSQLAAQVNGLSAGWFSPAGRIHVFRPGTLSFTVTCRQRAIDHASCRSHPAPPHRLCRPRWSLVVQAASFGYALLEATAYVGKPARPAHARRSRTWAPPRGALQGAPHPM